jgi:hypothetical protein
MSHLQDYQDKANAERLACQHPPVTAAAKEILVTLKNIERYLYWALDPEEKDGGAYYAQNLLANAHELVDQAHAYRAALIANPPPKDAEE